MINWSRLIWNNSEWPSKLEVRRVQWPLGCHDSTARKVPGRNGHSIRKCCKTFRHARKNCTSTKFKASLIPCPFFYIIPLSPTHYRKLKVALIGRKNKEKEKKKTGTNAFLKPFCALDKNFSRRGKSSFVKPSFYYTRTFLIPILATYFQGT